MWKKITDSRLFYIIFSLLLAFILWLYVCNAANPIGQGTLRGVQVVFSGMEKLEERGLMISEGDAQTVTLSVNARRDVLSKLNEYSDDITAVVDVSNITDTGEISLAYTISYPRALTYESIDQRIATPSRIQITVSKWAVKEDIEVRGVFSGSVAEGYQKGEFSFAPATITISGQQELVDRVDYALVTISQENLSETYSRDIPFTLIDFDGNAMPAGNLEINVDTILTTLPVVKLKEVPLTVTLLPGGGATGDEDTVVDIRPSTIVVSGSEGDLDALKEVSLGEIDLSKIFGTDTFTKPIQLSPELTNISGVAEATVIVRIQGLSTRALEVSNIEIINVPEGYRAEKVTQSSVIQIRGSEEAVAAVAASQLRIVADLKDINVALGTQTVPVKVRLDGSSDVGVVGEYNISISISVDDGSDDGNDGE